MRRNKLSLFRCFVWPITLLAMPLVAGMANAYILDHYNTGSNNRVSIAGPSSSGFGSSAVTASGVELGGHRYIFLSVGNNSTSNPSLAEVILDAVDHRYSVNLPDGDPGQGDIYYTGADDNTSCINPPKNLWTGDLAATEFRIQRWFVNDNQPIVVEVWAGASCPGTKYTAYAVLEKCNVDCTAPVVIPYTSFSPAPGDAFKSVQRLAISWEATGALTSNDFSIHSLGGNCTIGPPSASLSANPLQVPSLPGTTNLTWNITNGNLQRADIINGCVSPSQTTTNVGASGSSVSYPVEVVPPGGCEITLKAIGQCDNNTDSVRITSEPSKVPSLNEWGIIILSLILAASAVWLVRRRRTS